MIDRSIARRLVVGLAAALVVLGAAPGGAGADGAGKPKPKHKQKQKQKKIEKATKMECTQSVTPAQAGELGDIIRGLPEGAVLCLGPGRYEYAGIVLDKSITLRGTGAGPADVVIDGGGRGALVAINRDARRVTLERLTLTGGAAVISAGAIAGGAGEELVVREVVLEGNRADGEAPGGAIGLQRGRTLLERCRIVDNRGRTGAAIFAGGNAQVVLRSTLVADNFAERSVVRVEEHAHLSLEHATVAGNRGSGSALDAGGRGVGRPVVTVSDSIVTGAVVNDARAPGSITLVRSVVSGPTSGVTDEGTSRAADPALAGDGDEPYRPRPGSPAIGLARGVPGALDLAGKPSGTTAGALEP